MLLEVQEVLEVLGQEVLGQEEQEQQEEEQGHSPSPSYKELMFEHVKGQQ